MDREHRRYIKYFGKDELDIIGCDTLLNTCDIYGIMMVGIQALEKRQYRCQRKNSSNKTTLNCSPKLHMVKIFSQK
ncbi:hypothetical protein GM418_04765 [Maribellus comscasis]|uniref:Uncharacterized protein n=1 Tax=Maribellus comscasis TaxID=2681766 RepID=A0A6I6JS62_9BACT|nr:hypothetical protein [Maribellus comscasis]QGY42992.1 hypothetical protein GM418_04765 [Maribellus comscasis]